jgi:hypothetical protein
VSGRKSTLAAAALAAAFALLAPRFAAAQLADEEEGPIVVGQRRAYDRLYLEHPQIGLNLVNVYQHDTNKTAGNKVETQDILLEQSVDLSTHGYILSPNFFTLSLSGSAGVNEDFTHVDDNNTSDSSQDSGALYEWDVEGTFQPNGDTPLTLYSRREQGWIFREFGPALQTTTTDTGATLELRASKLPTRFGVSHVESDQNSSQDVEDFSYTRDGFDWHTTYFPTNNQTFNWDYTFSSINQSGVTDQQYDTHDARLTHDVTFGPRGRH